MIVIMQPGATPEQVRVVEQRLRELGFKSHPIYGEEKTVIGAVGDTKALSSEAIVNLPGVEKLVPIMKPYKLVSKELKGAKTVVEVRGVTIGGDRLVVMAGPCAVESWEQLVETAGVVKEAGAQVLRGGAFKPRTSPYAFQGLEEKGLEMLARVREETGMPVVTEAVDTRNVNMVAHYADIIQIGARNMQNFQLLREAGLTGKPILLKRGLAATIEEWLMAAEYIMAAGNPQVILCERGIRTYENATRNTVDISAVPVIRENSHLPVIVDPSHGTGNWKLVNPMAKAAVAAGADGVMVEVHPDPSRAFCDGPQSLNPEKFKRMMTEMDPLAKAIGRIL